MNDGKIQGSCDKCKAKGDIVKTELVKMKNGRDALKGSCPKCNTGMYRILSKSEHTELSRSIV